jgi:hypothetical protein
LANGGSLDRLAAHSAGDPFILGYALADYQRRFDVSDAALGAAFCCGMDVARSLSLWRRPGVARDSARAEDMAAIAAQYGIDAEALGRVAGVADPLAEILGGLAVL